jgi:magnesium-dependent phosphatase 1
MRRTALSFILVLITAFVESFVVYSKNAKGQVTGALPMGSPKTVPPRDCCGRPSGMAVAPKLIVFDLDNTLWTPELYFIRNLERGAKPVAGKDIDLFPGAQQVIQMIRDGTFCNTQFALASRTSSVDWAHDLLHQFNIRHLFQYVEIYPGDKTAHFSKLQAASGISYCDMLFFDDARHGKYGNCLPVAEMGVLSVHCPNGLKTVDLFHTALKRYEEWNGSKGAVVEWDGSLTYSKLCPPVSTPVTRHHGHVNFVNHEKNFGFIRYRDTRAKDVYFLLSSLSPKCGKMRQGDIVSFTVHIDRKNSKPIARDLMITSKEDTTSVSSNDSAASMTSSPMVTLRAFSMNMPFAALLANGYKTLETRNGTMFVPYPEGTQMLLHVGQRTYPDGDRHVEIMTDHGLSANDIDKLKELPKGFERGSIVAICELGRTMEMTLEERSAPWIQRQVAAYGKDSGKMVTEIKSVQYLKQPFPFEGQGGVFKVQIPADFLPDNWTLHDEQAEWKTEEQQVTNIVGVWSKPIYTVSG